jgi:hypothetical protein
MKPWLVPPYNSNLSFHHKTKYDSIVARQAALSARICNGSTWEIAADLVLDRPKPSTGPTLQKLLLAIPSQAFP